MWSEVHRHRHVLCSQERERESWPKSQVAPKMRGCESPFEGTLPVWLHNECFYLATVPTRCSPSRCRSLSQAPLKSWITEEPLLPITSRCMNIVSYKLRYSPNEYSCSHLLVQLRYLSYRHTNRCIEPASLAPVLPAPATLLYSLEHCSLDAPVLESMLSLIHLDYFRIFGARLLFQQIILTNYSLHKLLIPASKRALFTIYQVLQNEIL